MMAPLLLKNFVSLKFPSICDQQYFRSMGSSLQQKCRTHTSDASGDSYDRSETLLLLPKIRIACLWF